MLNKQQIPWMMSAARAALGPVVVVGERCHWNAFGLVALIVTALLSDIFDGVLARRWKCDTAAVRLFDSSADTVFYLGVAVAIYTGLPAFWAAYRTPILALLAFEAFRLAFDLLQFGKPASYHSYLTKTWGLVLAAAVVATVATQDITPFSSRLMLAAITLGFLCNLESLAMSLILPEWRHDIKTLRAAWRLRYDITLQTTNGAPQRSVSPAHALKL